MKILLHGNMVNRRWLFKCKRCGCVFEADTEESNRDYFFDGDGELHISVHCGCPECGVRAFAENSEGYDINDKEDSE